MNAMCAVRTSGSEEEEQALLPRIFPKGLLSLELLVDIVLIRILQCEVTSSCLITLAIPCAGRYRKGTLKGF